MLISTLYKYTNLFADFHSRRTEFWVKFSPGQAYNWRHCYSISLPTTFSTLQVRQIFYILKLGMQSTNSLLNHFLVYKILMAQFNFTPAAFYS